MFLALNFRTILFHSPRKVPTRISVAYSHRNMSANANNTPHAPIIDVIKQAPIPSLNPGAILSKRYNQEQIPDLSGRTAVVLGGSAGIGSAIAAGLALAQARVLIISTTEEHGAQTIDSVNEQMREAGSSGCVSLQVKLSGLMLMVATYSGPSIGWDVTWATSSRSWM